MMKQANKILVQSLVLIAGIFALVGSVQANYALQNTSGASTRYYQTMYQGKVAYYIPPRCCDIPSALFDQNWKLICYPDGGFAGGDGKCPGFVFDQSKSKRVVRKINQQK